VTLKLYKIGNREVRVHHRLDDDDIVQAWLYEDGVLADTILSIESDRKQKVVAWFFGA
jgi:hypothetical protein